MPPDLPTHLSTSTTLNINKYRSYKASYSFVKQVQHVNASKPTHISLHIHHTERWRRYNQTQALLIFHTDRRAEPMLIHVVQSELVPVQLDQDLFTVAKCLAFQISDEHECSSLHSLKEEENTNKWMYLLCWEKYSTAYYTGKYKH